MAGDIGRRSLMYGLYSLIELVYFAWAMNLASAASYGSFFIYPKATADGGMRTF